MKRMMLILALVLAPLAAFAQLELDKKYFKLTYPAGWATNPFLPSNDSLTMVMDTANDAFSWSHGTTGVGPENAALYASVLTQIYTQSFVRTDSSVKTLGGKSFITTGWKDTADGDTTGRVRIYLHQQGSFLFISWVVFDVKDEARVVRDIEATLATLVIKPAAVSIRRVAWNRHLDADRPRIDVMGRTYAPVHGGARIPGMPYYRR